MNVARRDGVLFGGTHSAVNNRFDAEPKRWRMLSSIALDSAMFLELLTPLVPQYFLPIASVANIGKNVSFLAASASRATIHKSFAIHENLADVTAKAGSQTIAASMIGTGLGVLVSTQLGSDWSSIAMGCLAFSAIHLTCTYRSLMHVVLNTVSIQVRLKSRCATQVAGILKMAGCLHAHCVLLVYCVRADSDLTRSWRTSCSTRPFPRQNRSQVRGHAQPDSADLRVARMRLTPLDCSAQLRSR